MVMLDRYHARAIILRSASIEQGQCRPLASAVDGAGLRENGTR
jgi:hypothetical protein